LDFFFFVDLFVVFILSPDPAVYALLISVLLNWSWVFPNLSYVESPPAVVPSCSAFIYFYLYDDKRVLFYEFSLLSSRFWSLES